MMWFFLVPEDCFCCFDPEHFYFSGMKMEGCGPCFPLGPTDTTMGERTQSSCLPLILNESSAPCLDSTLQRPLYSLKMGQSLALPPFLHPRVQGQVPLKCATTRKRGKERADLTLLCWNLDSLRQRPQQRLSLPSVEWTSEPCSVLLTSPNRGT